jgi:DeoR family transcriptional regulator of aga operon
VGIAMKRAESIVDSRLDQVLKALRRNGSITVEKVCYLTGVSVATARRDLQTLEDRGLLRRNHGGAQLIEPMIYEAFRHDSTFDQQMKTRSNEKRRIAAAAAELVQDGETIALTAGTTTTEVVRNLRDRRDITVVTNTVNVAMELSRQKNVSVFVTGGHLRGDWFSLVGATAARAIRQFYLDKVFIGANAVDPVLGPMCYNSEEADVNRAMVNHARKRILVADHSKFAATAPHRICSLQYINIFVTDSGATDDDIAPYVTSGIEVIRV